MPLLTSYLLSNQTFSLRKERVFSVTVLIVWWLAVLLGLHYHEFFRDEVHPLTVALEPHSIFNIFTGIKNEGHPVIWFFLLRFFHEFYSSPAVLPIVSIGVAFSGVAIFFYFAPFPNWQKILFIFGVFPIYQYSVVARDYGIAMPLLFLFAHFYRTRKEHPLILAICLLVLANTTAHACLIAAVLFMVWAVEYYFFGRQKLALHLGCFSLVVFGGVFAAITMMPTGDTALTSAFSTGIGFRDLGQAIVENLRHPAAFYPSVFPMVSPLIRDLVFWVLVVGLCVKPIRAAGLVLGMILLGSFFLLVTHEHIRHAGMFYLLMITLYWITVADIGHASSFRQSLHRWVVSAGFGVILAVHFVLGGQAIWSEVKEEKSSVRRFAEFVNRSSPDAILMPEPGYLLEALPYYSNNEIFFIREKKYAKRAQVTIHADVDLSIDQLLKQAQILGSKRGKTVLIVLFHLDLASREIQQIEFPNGKRFSWTDESLTQFHRMTEKVGDFKGASGVENLEVYRLK
jgi:hypothetical protein